MWEILIIYTLCPCALNSLAMLLRQWNISSTFSPSSILNLACLSLKRYNLASFMVEVPSYASSTLFQTLCHLQVFDRLEDLGIKDICNWVLDHSVGAFVPHLGLEPSSQALQKFSSTTPQIFLSIAFRCAHILLPNTHNLCHQSAGACQHCC